MTGLHLTNRMEGRLQLQIVIMITGVVTVQLTGRVDGGTITVPTLTSMQNHLI